MHRLSETNCKYELLKTSGPTIDLYRTAYPDSDAVLKELLIPTFRFRLLTAAMNQF